MGLALLTKFLQTHYVWVGAIVTHWKIWI